MAFDSDEARQELRIWDPEGDCGQFDALAYLANMHLIIRGTDLEDNGEDIKRKKRLRTGNLFKRVMRQKHMLEHGRKPGDKDKISATGNETAALRNFAYRHTKYGHPILLESLFRVLIGDDGMMEPWELDPSAQNGTALTEIVRRKRTQWRNAKRTARGIFDLEAAFKKAYPKGIEDTFTPDSFDHFACQQPTVSASFARIMRQVFRADLEAHQYHYRRFLSRDDGHSSLRPVAFSSLRWDVKEPNKITKSRLLIYPPDDEHQYIQFVNIAMQNPEETTGLLRKPKPRWTIGIGMPLNHELTAFIGRIRGGRNNYAVKCILVGKMSANEDYNLANGIMITRGVMKDLYLASRATFIREVFNNDRYPTRLELELNRLENYGVALCEDVGQYHISDLPDHLGTTMLVQRHDQESMSPPTMRTITPEITDLLACQFENFATADLQDRFSRLIDAPTKGERAEIAADLQNELQGRARTAIQLQDLW